MRMQETGDQHVGRCASGLDAAKAEFAVCRAHFDFSTLATEEERIERDRSEKKTARIPAITIRKRTLPENQTQKITHVDNRMGL